MNALDGDMASGIDHGFAWISKPSGQPQERGCSDGAIGMGGDVDAKGL